MNKRLCVGILVILLLGTLANVQATPAQDQELIDAAEDGDLAMVEALLSAGADVDAKNAAGVTALIYAAYYGHTEVIEVLITAGADVNAKANNGATALMIAEAMGHTDIVEILKAAGAKE